METGRPETRPSPMPEDRAPESIEEVVAHDAPVNLSTGGPPQPVFKEIVRVNDDEAFYNEAGVTNDLRSKSSKSNRSTNAKRHKQP